MKLQLKYKTDTISYGDADSPKSLEISSWQPLGALLAVVEGDKTGTGSGDADQIELIAWDNTTYSADGSGLLAEKPGYPVGKIEKNKNNVRVMVKIEPTIVISDDKWTAKLRLYPPIREGDSFPDEATILQILEEEGVVYGIRKKKLHDAVEQVKARREPVTEMVIARGRLPVNGKNARLRMAFNNASISGKEDGSGAIDFHERNIFVGVEKGQVLATKVKATDGVAGVNIFGHEIPQIKGKDLSFTPGPDILMDEVTGEITAAISGVVSAVNENSIKISDLLSISSDIDYATGNINCRGGLEISGTVKPDFLVKAGGDLVIGGNIESAEVNGGGNVIIRGGMVGNSPKIKALGDVSILYLESGVIRCGGDAEIIREAYYSQIYSGRNIKTGEKGVIVGSKLFAGGSIELVDIDTDSSPRSFLAAAVDYERYQRYIELKQEAAQLGHKIMRLQHRLGPKGSNEQLEDLKDELDELVEELNELNLVPGTPDNDVASGLRYASQQKIEIRGEAKDGITVRIGNFEITTRRISRNGYFSLVGETGEITFTGAAQLQL